MLPLRIDTHPVSLVPSVTRVVLFGNRLRIVCREEQVQSGNVSPHFVVPMLHGVVIMLPLPQWRVDLNHNKSHDRGR